MPVPWPTSYGSRCRWRDDISKRPIFKEPALKSLRTIDGIICDHRQFDGMIEKLQTFLK